jgi:hypothetical protein
LGYSQFFLYIAHHQFFVKCWKQITVLLQLANASPPFVAKDRFPPLLSQSFLSVCFCCKYFPAGLEQRESKAIWRPLGLTEIAQNIVHFFKAYLFSAVGMYR